MVRQSVLSYTPHHTLSLSFPSFSLDPAYPRGDESRIPTLRTVFLCASLFCISVPRPQHSAPDPNPRTQHPTSTQHPISTPHLHHATELAEPLRIQPKTTQTATAAKQHWTVSKSQHHNHASSSVIHTRGFPFWNHQLLATHFGWFYALNSIIRRIF